MRGRVAYHRASHRLIVRSGTSHDADRSLRGRDLPSAHQRWGCRLRHSSERQRANRESHASALYLNQTRRLRCLYFFHKRVHRPIRLWQGQDLAMLRYPDFQLIAQFAPYAKSSVGAARLFRGAQKKPLVPPIVFVETESNLADWRSYRAAFVGPRLDKTGWIQFQQEQLPEDCVTAQQIFYPYLQTIARLLGR